jgi:hypothetical protein
LALGIFEVEGMAPMGAGLQEPPLICSPSVIGRLDNVAQKLMKLLVEVKEGTSPASEVFTFSPFLAKLGATRLDSRVREV